MKITLYGAAGEVTGSSYHVQTDRANVLVDFGMFQGVPEADARNAVPEGLNPASLDAVVLTHGHLDHSGRLPLLVKNGFRGKIHATPATISMAGLILRDSAKVQAQDLERTNRKRRRAGKDPVGPMYDREEVEQTLSHFQGASYKKVFPIADGISIQLVEAGHMLGSASIQMIVEESGRKKTVAFSGDLGPTGLPVLKDAECLSHADLVFLESTYGDRDHRSMQDTLKEGKDIIQRAVERRGKILVPAFAVGRTQQIIYHVTAMIRNGAIEEIPIYIDSPMAIEATRIYAQHPELYDEEAAQLAKAGELAIDLKQVKTCETADESKALNDLPGSMLIIAGSGMCNAGRILHHFRNHLWQPETSVIIVGYQAQGTLGRLLVEGAPEIKIFGETIAVKAEVHSLGGFSAHAGQTGLLQWLDCVVHSRPRIILTHGEERGREPLARKIKEQHGIEAECPMFGDTIEL